ncbi:MAG: leucine-rich repeat domain-containing protein, partial [Saprospiraceae bacterium]
MSELALQRIAENKAKHARGEDARRLDLGNCGLTEVPEEIKDCTWLQILILRGNQNIESLEPIKRLTNLWQLDIPYTSIGDLSPVREFENLEVLKCQHTPVKDLLPLKNLKRLRKLNLCFTQVEDLSPILHLMRRGIRVRWGQWGFSDTISIDSGLKYPPVEIARQGTSAILRYFEDLEKQGNDQIYEAKAILIG